MNKKTKEIIEGLGWSIYEGNGHYNISKYSNLGEDFSFSIFAEDEKHEIREILDFCYDFDYEDHASYYIENRGKNGIPSSIRALLDDAEEIAEDLEKLADELVKLL